MASRHRSELSPMWSVQTVTHVPGLYQTVREGARGEGSYGVGGSKNSVWSAVPGALMLAERTPASEMA